MFTAIGLLVLSILFLIAGYVSSVNYMIVLTCVSVAYLYSSKVLFNTTFGEVVISGPRSVHVKIKDVFYNYNSTYTIDTTKKPAIKSLVSLRLNNSVFRKPVEVIEVLCDNTKIITETAKIQKTPKKQIKTRKNTKISKKKKK